MIKMKSSADATSDDVVILDKGLEIYLWKGKTCSKDYTFKASLIVAAMKSERNGKPSTETLDEEIDRKSLFEKFVEEQSHNGADDDDDDDDDEDDSAYEDNEDETPELFRLSDADGHLSFEEAGDTNITRKDLKDEDVFILDTKKDCFVWIGKQASQNEKKNAFSYAHTYLQKTKHPLIPITCVESGKENRHFRSAIAA